MIITIQEDAWRKYDQKHTKVMRNTNVCFRVVFLFQKSESISFKFKTILNLTEDKVLRKLYQIIYFHENVTIYDL